MDYATYKGVYNYNAKYVAFLLRISDLLDIDESRTPLYLFELLKPSNKPEWVQHYCITNFDKIFECEDNQKVIRFYGRSTEANIHRKILKYIDYIDLEISEIINTSDKFFDEKYRIKLKPCVENHIETPNFTFSDLRLTLDYHTVSHLLMGENIYGDKKYGFREVLQNSIVS